MTTDRLSILVIGFGAREHALLWKLARSPRAGRLFAAPGNAGTASIATNVPIDENDVERLVAFALERRIDLTVVGPTRPLAAGIVDRFTRAGLRIFGPTAAAARLETSKLFAKSLMHDLSIPTPPFSAFTEYDDAVEYVRHAGTEDLVVKIDGLGQRGRGVSVCSSTDEAIAALHRYFSTDRAPIIVEHRLYGPEVSFFAITDGRTVLPLLPVRDYKRLQDGDLGPNTGGMGAVGPVSAPGGEFPTEHITAMLSRTVEAMAEASHPVVGVLYAGVMFTALGPQLLEFNLRFGNPEALVLLPLLECDLVELLLACLDGQLAGFQPGMRDCAAAAIVAATQGCGDGPAPRLVVNGLDGGFGDDLPDTLLLHHGTTIVDGRVLSTRERVVAAASVAPSLSVALQRAYEALARVRFDGMHVRRDIGHEFVSEIGRPARFPASAPG